MALEARLQEAQELAGRGKLVLARKQLEGLVRDHAADPRPWVQLTQVLRGLGDDVATSEVYQQAVAACPAEPALWFNRGNHQQRTGELAASRESFERAIELAPELGPAHFNLGNVLRDLEELEAAERAYRRCLELTPELARCHKNLGNLLRRQERIEEAIAAHREAIRLDPEDPEAHLNLGNALLQDEQFDEAFRALRCAVDLRPGFVEAIKTLAPALYRHRTREARHEVVVLYRRLRELEPDELEHRNSLGVALQAAGEMDAAVAELEEVVRQDPDHAPARNNLGIMYRTMRRPHDGIAHLRRALELAPEGITERYNLAFSLLELGRVEEADQLIEEVLERDPEQVDALLAQGLSRHRTCRPREAIESFRRVLEYQPGHLPAISNACFSSLYDVTLSPQEVTALHRELTSQIECPRVFGDWPNDPDPERPLRIGYVSPDFRSHPVGFFFEPVLEYHAEDVEAFCYSLVAAPDETTRRIRGDANHWRDCLGWPADRLAEQIREDRIDVLVEMTGHTGGNQMAVLKQRPAPVQILYIGYPCTTGLDEVTHLVTDRHVSPPGCEALYSEKLLRLPGSFWCYRPPEWAPAPNRLPALTRGYPTFGSANAMPKLSDPTLELWSRVLREIPGAKLRLKALALEDQATRRRTEARFQEYGIPPERLELVGPTLRFDRFLHSYHDLDVALDPIRYNGGTTTCQALTMGVPVVTLPGDHFMSRMSASFLENVGLGNLVARDPDDFVAICKRLVDDLPALAEHRRSLPGRMLESPICDAPRAAEELEGAYREAWREWCSGRLG